MGLLLDYSSLSRARTFGLRSRRLCPCMGLLLRGLAGLGGDPWRTGNPRSQVLAHFRVEVGDVFLKSLNEGLWAFHPPPEVTD